jgi:hypothetical protein
LPRWSLTKAERDRLKEVIWVLDHLDDIESDLSVFHRIDNMYDMPPVRFFRFALRLVAYNGIVRARVEAEQAKKHRKHKGKEVRQGTYTDPSVSMYFDEG